MPDETSYTPPPAEHAAGAPEAAPYASPYSSAATHPYAADPHRGRHSRRFWVLTIGGSLLAVAALFAIFVWAVVRSMNNGDAENDIATTSQKIGVIDVDGVILTADTLGPQLRRMADKSDVKAIILHINSPGGGAAASQELYNEVVRIRREKHKPIVASIESVGASGAYYIAAGCDKIYANDASVVGSIGVIMEWTNYGDLLRWAKLKNVVLKAGELKDAGDPTRDMTPKEQAYFQSLVDNMYGQFVHDVSVGRSIPEDKLRPLATGQVWTGQQAKSLGLIDKEGGFREALMDTAKNAGIKGEPGIERPTRTKKNLLSLLASGDAGDLFPNPSRLLDQSPGFFFLWK